MGMHDSVVLTFVVDTPSIRPPLDPMVAMRTALVHREGIVFVTVLLPNEVEPLNGLGLSLGLDPGFCDLACNGAVQPRCGLAGHCKVQRVCAMWSCVRKRNAKERQRSKTQQRHA